jgi:hypothetical protein
LEFGHILGVLGKPSTINQIFESLFHNFQSYKVWKILILEWILLLGNSKKLQKLGSEGKINGALNVFT